MLCLSAHAGNAESDIQFLTVGLRRAFGQDGEIPTAEIAAEFSDALA